MIQSNVNLGWPDRDTDDAVGDVNAPLRAINGSVEMSAIQIANAAPMMSLVELEIELDLVRVLVQKIGYLCREGFAL